jgi:hypothetical protein
MLFPSTKKTVDGVLSAFSKTIADLRDVASTNEVQAARHEQEIEDAKKALTSARIERERALSAATKLEGLIGAV